MSANASAINCGRSGSIVTAARPSSSGQNQRWTRRDSSSPTASLVRLKVTRSFSTLAIAAAEAELEGRGRLVIRKSGTEPLIRVMAEGDDPALVERLVDDICEAVQSAA